MNRNLLTTFLKSNVIRCPNHYYRLLNQNILFLPGPSFYHFMSKEYFVIRDFFLLCVRFSKYSYLYLGLIYSFPKSHFTKISFHKKSCLCWFQFIIFTINLRFNYLDNKPFLLKPKTSKITINTHSNTISFGR